MKEVYFAESNQTSINSEILTNLEQTARKTKRGRARFCLHMTPDETLQEMVIALRFGAYIPPHRQTNTAKSYVILKGKIKIVFFDSIGTIEETIAMSPAIDVEPSIIRFPADRWHTVISTTDLAIYMELITGPYCNLETEMAAWAPKENEHMRAVKFINKLASA